MTTEPAEYIVAHVREALATDPRVNELGLDVQVQGDEVVVTGSVMTEGRRAAIAKVVEAAAPECRVRNQASVVTFSEPGW